MLEPMQYRLDWGMAPVIIGFINFVSATTSQWHTVALSIDRWIPVDYALNYHSIMSPFCLKLLVAASWIIGFTETLLITLVQLFVGNKVIWSRIRTLVTAMHILVIFSINATIYGRLWNVARKQRRQISQLQQQQANTTGINKATVMVMVIVALFGLLWLPVIVTYFWYSFVGDSNSKASTALYYSLLGGYSNSLINCAVYVFFNKNIRKQLSKYLTCKDCIRET